MLDINNFKDFELENTAFEGYTLCYATTKNLQVAEKCYKDLSHGGSLRDVAKEFDGNLKGVEIGLQIEKETGALALFTYGIVMEDAEGGISTEDVMDISTDKYTNKNVIEFLMSSKVDLELISLVAEWLDENFDEAVEKGFMKVQPGDTVTFVDGTGNINAAVVKVVYNKANAAKERDEKLMRLFVGKDGESISVLNFREIVGYASDNQKRWIPVEERSPKENLEVALYVKGDDGVQYMIGKHRENDTKMGYWLIKGVSDQHEYLRSRKIIAWMPFEQFGFPM